MAAIGARRRPKVYRNRINPMVYFDEQDFRARYRLPKHMVAELSNLFENSPFISTTGDPRGSGISSEERVSTFVTA